MAFYSNQNRLERAKEIALVSERICNEISYDNQKANYEELLEKAIVAIVDNLKVSPKIARREAISYCPLRTEKKK
jgi:hypothetical protein